MARPETPGYPAAARAEWAYAGLAKLFIGPPRGRISLVISDNSDRPNASATPIPFNRVTVVATPQLANRQLNNYTDWLDVTLVVAKSKVLFVSPFASAVILTSPFAVAVAPSM